MANLCDVVRNVFAESLPKQPKNVMGGDVAVFQFQFKCILGLSKCTEKRRGIFAAGRIGRGVLWLGDVV